MTDCLCFQEPTLLKMDDPEGGAGSNVERSGQHATLKKKRAKKVRAPQREGWLEVYQEVVHVAYLETDKQVYKRKWVMLRDCWLYLYDNQDHVTLGRDAPSVVSIDLRGAVCNRELELERTFYLESSYLYSVQGLKHKIHCRTAAEEDIQVWSAVMSNPDHCRVCDCRHHTTSLQDQNHLHKVFLTACLFPTSPHAQPWMSDINESSIWEVVLRAAAGSVARKAAARGRQGKASAGELRRCGSVLH